MSERTVRRLLALILVAFVGLGVTYTLVTPCFEAPDEWSHLALVHYFATYRTLPPRVLPDRRAIGPDVGWFLEYHDPPLYYAPPLYHALGALLTAWIDTGDLPRLVVPSPSWEVGWAPQANSDPRNKNVFAHSAEETIVQSGTVRAVYLLRLVSLGLGAVTVLCTYALARLLWPERIFLALGAAVFVACNPQFIFVSAGVTNDNLLNALFSLCLMLAVRFMRDGALWWHWAGLGALVGLGLLTKQSALLLLPVVILAVSIHAWRQYTKIPSLQRRPFIIRRWSFVICHWSLIVVPALVVSGWWYGRNVLLYGDIMGLDPHFAVQTPLARFGLNEAWMVARSYWAGFGWAPILVEPPLYVIVGLVVLVAIAGVVMAVHPGGSLWQASPMIQYGLALIMFALGLNVVSFVRWAIATGAPVGRLLFPTLPVVGVLAARGLAEWARWPAVRWIVCVIAGLAFVFAGLVPWRYLRPAFASPRLPRGIPDAAQAVDVAFQGGVRLAGYEPLSRDLSPGETVHFVVYWRAPTAPHHRYRVWAQLGPRDPTRRVAEDSDWLGGTLYPSDIWQDGDTVRQVFRFTIPDWSPAPGLYWVRLGLLDGDTRVALADYPGDMAVLGPWRMQAVGPTPKPACVTDYRLGESVWLRGYGVEKTGETLTVTLYWQAERAPETDYTVFVHLLDEEGNRVAQHDGPPRGGEYPTSWWRAGERVSDVHVLLSECWEGGPFYLQVGMYHPESLERLPVHAKEDQHLPNDAILFLVNFDGGCGLQHAK